LKLQGGKMKNIFREIDEYWSWQKNNEIYVKGKNLEEGSPEYWQTIESERHRYLYYLPEILDFFSCGSGKKLLEIGCGMGMDLAYFVKNGFKGTGIDLAQGHIKMAREYFEFKKLPAELLHMNAEKLSFPENSFDCAYSFGVLHHTQTPQNGINEIYRILRPGGRCVVMLYHRNSLNNFVHWILRMPFDNCQTMQSGGKDANFVFRYSKSEVKKMFHQFEKVDVRLEYAYGAGWEPIYSWTPNFIYNLLSRSMGWHIVISAEK